MINDKLSKVRAEIEKYQKQIQAGAVDNRISKEKAEAYRICVKLISTIDSLQEEPKECMYSKSNYKDKDRKVLCDGCEEECKYSKLNTMLDDVLSKETKESWNKRLDEELVSKNMEAEFLRAAHNLRERPLLSDWFRHFYLMGRQHTEPTSGDLEQAIDTYLATYFGGEKEKRDWPFLKKMAIHFANWQKQKDAEAINENALLYSARLEGIEIGKAEMKQQLLAKAVDVTVHIEAGGYPYIPQLELYDYDKDIPLAKEGDKYKVILIKED